MRRVLCALAVAALAYGSAPSAFARTPAPALKDACAYLTKEDATTALGEAVTGPQSKPTFDTGGGGTASSCEYSGSGINRVHLNLIVMTPAQATIYAGLCAKKTKDGLSGLGPVACWYNDKHGELQVLKGTTFLSIEMHRSGDPTEAIKGVAKAVYGRLP